MEKLDNLLDEFQNEKYKSNLTNENSTLDSSHSLYKLKEILDKKKLANINLHQLFFHKLNDLKKLLQVIEPKCSLYDYKNIKANGLRTLFKINMIAIDKISQKLIKYSYNEKTLFKCCNLILVLIKLDELVVEYEEKKYLDVLNNNKDEEDNEQENSSLFFSYNFTTHFFKHYIEFCNELEFYVNNFALFFYPPKLSRNIMAIANLLAFHSKFPFSYFSNKKKRSKFLTKALVKPTSSWPLALMDVIDSRLHNDIIVPLVHIKSNVTVQTVYIPHQFRWLLNDFEKSESTKKLFTLDENWTYEELAKSNLNANKENKYKTNTKENKIRIRIIENKSKVKSGVVMFHVHGGAFSFHSPDCHEIYVRDFAKEFPEIVIFSVDYKLKNKFPIAQQDVLDAYLWLTSGLNEVKETLGFQPTKILLCGDSAGAFLTFVLKIILDDLNDHAKLNALKDTFVLPSALFFIYGFYSVSNITPVMFCNFFDLILPPSVIRLTFGSLYYGLDKGHFYRRIFLPQTLSKKKRWYLDEDYDQISKTLLEKFSNHPYLTPIFKSSFKKDIPIYLITSDYDICLDNNIELAKKWKSEVTLEIIENLPHGFMQMGMVDKVCQNAINQVLVVLRKAVNKLNDEHS